MDVLGVRSNESPDSVIKSEKDYYVLFTVRDKQKIGRNLFKMK